MLKFLAPNSTKNGYHQGYINLNGQSFRYRDVLELKPKYDSSSAYFQDADNVIDFYYIEGLTLERKAVYPKVGDMTLRVRVFQEKKTHILECWLDITGQFFEGQRVHVEKTTGRYSDLLKNVELLHKAHAYFLQHLSNEQLISMGLVKQPKPVVVEAQKPPERITEALPQAEISPRVLSLKKLAKYMAILGFLLLCGWYALLLRPLETLLVIGVLVGLVWLAVKVREYFDTKIVPIFVRSK